jgi:ABC-2 type transport system ATP-binding protein
MIEVNNLSKNFNSLRAVDNISFRVEKGKIWGFLGPNGAGKTTTMRILTGYISPSSGSVLLNGMDVARESLKVKKMVGYLPEVVPVYPELTVKEYLHFVGEISGLRGKRLKLAVEKAVERTNLEEAFPRLIRTISKGFRQRLGIAQAIVHEPDILILDEPTIGLDPAQIIEIREMIRSFKGDTTVILSSHILPEISQVCDGAVVIKEGKLMSNLKWEEWSKNLEIIISQPGRLSQKEMLKKFKNINSVQISNYSVLIEYKELNADINPLLKYLITNRFLIKEIKAGLEGLYMNIISSEHLQPEPNRRQK